jgi:site-specific DNA-methyltransferase (adenine-specific)
MEVNEVNYPDDFINKIICGDCLEVMKDIPDKSIDLVLTDPPYGINYQSNFRTDKFTKIINDNDINLNVIKNIYRVLTENSALYLFTRWDVMSFWCCEINRYFKIKNVIVWYKKGGGIGDLKGSYIYNHEFCIFAVKGKHKLQGKRINDVWEINKDSVNNYQHPTQKPVKLFKQIIEKSSIEQDIILDPFIGSGTTAVACKSLGRRYIGIEINPEYCDIARKRVNATPKPLFV